MRRVHPNPKYPARNAQAGTVFTAAWLNTELRERFDAHREHLGLNVRARCFGLCHQGQGGVY